MRLNGLLLTIQQAANHLGDPLIDEYRHVIVLGSLREDVMYLPLVGRVWEHFSFSHFYKPPLPGGILPFVWPGPRFKAQRFFDRGVEHFTAGERPAAFLNLGRAAHLLTDMACPVHVHRVVHDTDMFEWYIESHRPELEALPLPEVPPMASAAAIIESLARYTAQFRPDKTQNAIGRWLKRRGLSQPVPRREVIEHARTIMPMAAAHLVRMFELFLARVDANHGAQAS
jgi:hypothetical protein